MKTFLRILPALLLMFLITNISAQQVTVTLTRPPLNQLRLSDLWNLSLNNTSPNAYQVYLKGNVDEQTDGPILSSKSQTFTLNPGIRQCNPNNTSSQNTNWFGNVNKYQNPIIHTGNAPSGTYDICVKVYDATTDTELGSDCVLNHTVLIVTAPVLVLVSPNDNEEISVKFPQFIWTPLNPAPTGQTVSYKIKIVKINNGQSPSDAMLNNTTLYSNNNIAITSYSYPIIAPDILFGNSYAWKVTAVSNGTDLASSDVWSFKATDPIIVQNPPQENQQNSNCNNTQNVTISGTTPATKTYAVGDMIHVGTFNMKLLSVTSGSSSALSGTGSIIVPWLKTPVSVDFTGIGVNSGDQMYSGDVTSHSEENTPDAFPKQWGINLVTGQWTIDKIKRVDQWLHNVLQGIPYADKLAAGFDLNQQVAQYIDAPLKFPIGLNNAKGVTVAITEMKFEPTSSKLNCVAAYSINDVIINDTLGLVGENIECSSSSPNFTSAKIGLVDDLTITNGTNNTPGDDTWDYTFKEMSGNNGTFVEWDCNGFKQLDIELHISLPRKFVTPVPQNNIHDKVKAKFSAVIEDWEDWLVSGTLDKCTITGTKGFVLDVPTLVYDHSDARNPQGINFPTNFDELDVAYPNLFRDIYIPHATVTLPDKFRTFNNPSQKLTISADDIIVNRNGLTCSLLAKNVINIPDGNVNGLGISIDTIKMFIKKSSIESAYLKGKIILPISETTNPDNSVNSLLYKAVLNSSTGFQFNIQPSGPITAKFFSDAKLTLNQTSNISLSIDEAFKFDIKLDGKFVWGNISVGPVKNVKMDMEFQNVGLHYDETNTNTPMTFNKGTWSFASPPKFLANFPVSISEIKGKIKQRLVAYDEVLRAGLSFSVNLNFDENKISGKTSLTVIGSILKDPTNGKFTPHFALSDVQVDTIALNLDLSAAKIDGKIAFYYDDPVWGDGFNGSLKAQFKTLNFEADASAIFGTAPISPGSNQRYRYFKFDAKVILPKPGIVFMSGLAFYGFGAGFWKNMNVQVNQISINDVAAANSIQKSTSSGLTFTPQAPINGQSPWGFKVTAVLGVTPDPKTFNADATLTAAFSGSGGLSMISFNLDYWAMADLLERSNAPVWGTVNISYVPPTKHFQLIGLLNINKPPMISTSNGPIALLFDVNGISHKWKFLLGKPSHVNSVSVFGTNIWEYFMFGNDIEVPTGFRQSTLDGLNSVGLSVPTFNSPVSNASETGKGFAVGVGADFNKSGQIEILRSGPVDVDLIYTASGGIEIDASVMKYLNGCGYSPPGLNGWYANAGLAAWIRLYLGLWVNTSWDDPETWDIVDLSAGGWLQAGFPNPYWLEGSATASYSCSLFSFSKNVDLSLGTRCNNMQMQPEAVLSNEITYNQEDVAEENAMLIKNVRPIGSTNGFNPDYSIGISFALKPDEPIDIEEQQADGSTIYRTFKGVYQIELDSIGPYDPNATNSGILTQSTTLQNQNQISRNYQPSNNNQQTNGQSINYQENTRVLLNNQLNQGFQTSQGTQYNPNDLSHQNNQTYQQFSMNNMNLTYTQEIVLWQSASADQFGEYQFRIDRGIGDMNTISFRNSALNLSDSTHYKLVVKGWLYEKIGGQWVIAKKKNGQEVKQTKTVSFSTGKKQVVTQTNQYQIIFNYTPTRNNNHTGR